MDSQLLLQSTYLDVIFDGRNKVYGGYQLRTTYPQRMKKAGIYIFTLALFFAAYSVWANRSKPLPAMPKNSQTDTLAFINTKLDIPDKPILPPKPAVGGSNVNTVKSTVLRVVDDEEVNPKEHIANQDDLTKAVVGKITLSGDSIGDESFDMNKSSKGTKGSDVIERGGATIKNVPLTFVEEMPEFPGGEQKLQEYLKAHIEYPNAAIDAVRQGKVLVRFVVNEDGTITNVEARNTIGFGLEEEAMRVVRAMPRWTPGKNNGIAVKVWFQVPIFFKLN